MEPPASLREEPLRKLEERLDAPLDGPDSPLHRWSPPSTVAPRR
jgi:hypothetical protein